MWIWNDVDGRVRGGVWIVLLAGPVRGRVEAKDRDGWLVGGPGVVGLSWPVLGGLWSGQGVSESLESGQEFVSPGPGVVDAEVELTASGGEAGSDMQEPVAQGFGFGIG